MIKKCLIVIYNIIRLVRKKIIEIFYIFHQQLK